MTTDVTDPVGFQAFYNAWSLDTILWVAKPTGFEHVIDKLQGTQQIPDVYDIELLTDLFYSIIGMPRSWFGAKSGSGGGEQAMSGKALLAQDMRFLRKIKGIRRPIINAYTWLGYFHAVLMGKDIRELDIKAMMPPIGSLEDQMKLEMLRQQAEVLDILADVMAKYNLPREAWVETVFKRYMRLPDDVVNLFITALPNEIEEPAMESLQKRPAPYSYRILREIEDKVRQNGDAVRLIEELRESMDEKPGPGRARFKRKTFEDQFTKKGMNMKGALTDFDLIVSSYGRHPMELRRTETGTPTPETNGAANGNGHATGQTLNESADRGLTPYRKFYPEKM